MNLIERISPSVNCPKLIILIKDNTHSELTLIRAADFNYYCHKYGHENVELIANKEGVEIYETYRATVV